MSTILIPITTEVGLQAFFDAEQHDIKVRVKYVGFGDQGYIPNRSQTSLKHEIIRVPIASGKVYKEDHILDLSCMLPIDAPEFWVREVGCYDENGTLLFVWSSPKIKIGYKSKFMIMLSGLRQKIVDVPFDRIEIVESNPDLKLLYAEEFLNIANGISALQGTVLFLADKTENNQTRIEKLEGEIVPKLESEIGYVRDALVPGVREELLSAVIANATALVEIQKILVDQKLNNL